MSKKLDLKENILHVIPGLVVCILIAILSKILEKYFQSLGAATLSIFIGILIGNTIGQKDILNKGTKFSEGTLLSISIVLLGATLNISSIIDIGVIGLSFILLQMLITIIGTLLIGKRMKFEEDFVLLMASGNAVCGSSAVASTAPVIKASSKDKGIAITMVNVTGTILMILLPLITSVAFSNETIRTSAFIGGILQSVGQVVAAASMINEEVKDLSTIYKIVRIIFLVLVVFLLAAIKKKNATKAVEEVVTELEGKKHKSRIKIPWYIIGFFVTCALYSLKIVPSNWSETIKEFDNFLEIVALAGIGMRVYVSDLLKQGIRTSIYCVFIGIVQIFSALTLITILFR